MYWCRFYPYQSYVSFNNINIRIRLLLIRDIDGNGRVALQYLASHGNGSSHIINLSFSRSESDVTHRSEVMNNIKAHSFKSLFFWLFPSLLQNNRTSHRKSIRCCGADHNGRESFRVCLNSQLNTVCNRLCRKCGRWWPSHTTYLNLLVECDVNSGPTIRHFEFCGVE